LENRISKDDLTILINGEEVELKSSVREALEIIINELIEPDYVTKEELFGDWVKTPRMKIATYLTGARHREGFTQKQVCEKLGIKQYNLSKIENGERPIPKKLIDKFAKLYNVKKKMLIE